MDMYRYNFPQCNRAGDVQTQLKHAAGEIVEAACESTSLNVAVETMDAIECLDGALRDISSMPGGTAVMRRAWKAHRTKNLRRGYYD